MRGGDTGHVAAPAAEPLEIEFCGALTRVAPGDPALGFGRRAEIEIDDNHFLHRRLGEFSWDGQWKLGNTGASIPLEIHDAVSLSFVVLASGGSIALPFATSVVRFAAGGMAYELVVRVADVRPLKRIETGDEQFTATIGHIPLTPSQKELIVALAELRLRDPRELGLPTNREAAARLGWELTRFNRKLDNVCDKLSRQGVRGLRGAVDALATDRRRRLVDFAVSTALVTAGDLDLLA